VTSTMENFSQDMQAFFGKMASEGVKHAAEGLSGMLGRELSVTEPSVKLLHINELSTILGGPEEEAVGIYLLAKGEFTAQIMLILPISKALKLVDMAMGEPIGTYTTLGSMARSALSEIGNITGSFFLSTIENMAGMEARPSPPAVIVDMVGAIINIVVATSGGISDYVLVMETKLSVGEVQTEAHFWVIPDRNVFELIQKRSRVSDG